MEGLSFLRRWGTSTHEVEEYVFNLPGGDQLVVEMIRSLKAPHSKFLPAQVRTSDGRMVWSFRNEGLSRGAYANLIQTSEGICIVVVANGKVVRALPLEALPHFSTIMVVGKLVTVGIEPAQLIRAKRLCAEKMGLGYSFSEPEMAWKEKNADLQKEEERQREEAKIAKVAEKRERIRTILDRVQFEAWTSTGIKVTGIPVVDGEWQILPDNISVILHKGGKPIEAFFVRRAGSGPARKVGLKFVSDQKPVRHTETTPLPEADGVFFCRIDGKLVQVFHFPKGMAAELRRAGLNNGTLVAFGEPVKGKYTVCRMEGDNTPTIGQFAPV